MQERHRAFISALAIKVKMAIAIMLKFFVLFSTTSSYIYILPLIFQKVKLCIICVTVKYLCLSNEQSKLSEQRLFENFW